MRRSLFKKFEKVYLELRILLEKAKSWGISEEKLIKAEESIESSYQKMKRSVQKEAQIYGELKNKKNIRDLSFL